VFVSSVVMSFGGRFFEIMCCVTPEGELEMERLALYDGDSRTTSNPNLMAYINLTHDQRYRNSLLRFESRKKKLHSNPQRWAPG